MFIRKLLSTLFLIVFIAQLVPLQSENPIESEVTIHSSMTSSSSGRQTEPELSPVDTFEPYLNVTILWEIINSTRVNFTVRVEAERNAPNTTATMDLPDDLVLMGGRTERNADLKSGGNLTMELSVQARVDGNWTLEAWAKSFRPSGYPLAGFDAVYMEVNQSNITVTHDFPNHTYAEEVEGRPPVRRSSRSRAGTIKVYGHWFYRDGNGIDRPYRFALVRLYDQDGGSDDLLETSYTDENGYYYFEVENSEGDGCDVYVRQYAVNDVVDVTNAGGSTYFADTDVVIDVMDGTDIDFGGLAVVGDNCGEIYNSMIDGFSWVKDETGWTRDRVAARWPAGDHAYSYGDFMTFHSDFTWDRPTQLHEYGHCIQWTAYGDKWPPTGFNDPHWYDSDFDPGFAMCEGWAEFFQCAVDNSANNIADGAWNIENNNWQLGADGDLWDGNSVEGCVASILWDIFDPANDDDLNMGFEEIWSIMLEDNPDEIGDVGFWDNWFSTTDGTTTNYGNANGMRKIYYDHGIDLNDPPIIQSLTPSGGWHAGTIDLTAEVSDPDGDLVSRVQFSQSLDGITWFVIGSDLDPKDGWTVTWDTTGVDADETAWISARAEDGMETGGYKTNTLSIDNHPPEVSVEYQVGGEVGKDPATDGDVVIFTVTGEDLGSGIHKVWLKWDDGTPHEKSWDVGDNSTFSSTHEVVGLEPGVMEYYVILLDAYGHQVVDPPSGAYMVNVVDDDVDAPVFSSPTPPETFWPTPVSKDPLEVGINIEDHSGVEMVKFSYKFGDGNWSEWKTPSGNSGDYYYYNVPKSAWEQHVKFFSNEVLYFKVTAWDVDNDRPDDALSNTSTEYKAYTIEKSILIWLTIGTPVVLIVGGAAILIRRRARRRMKVKPGLDRAGIEKTKPPRKVPKNMELEKEPMGPRPPRGDPRKRGGRKRKNPRR